MKADEIIKNAKIFTADKSRPQATALAVKDGKFVYVGDEAFHFAKGSLQPETQDDLGALAVLGEDSLYLNIWKNVTVAYRLGGLGFIHLSHLPERPFGGSCTTPRPSL
ncbi:MAG: hypothetical protein IJQ61_03460 [Bacteroidales bacterium]|nr:hypothetical protein [Bacteroidales bacterium]